MSSSDIQSDQFISLLSRLSARMQLRISRGGIDEFLNRPLVLSLPSGERWMVKAGEAPLMQTQISSDTDTIRFVSEDAVQRFVNGLSVPQEEVLEGEWEMSGDTEFLIFVTGEMFDLWSPSEAEGSL